MGLEVYVKRIRVLVKNKPAVAASPEDVSGTRLQARPVPGSTFRQRIGFPNRGSVLGGNIVVVKTRRGFWDIL